MAPLLGNLIFSALVLASFARGQVPSTNGIVYNCPNVETIEVAYLDDCPAYSRTMLYELAGSRSSAYSSFAPGNYDTAAGAVGLTCSYRAPGTTTVALVCYYSAGGSQSLQPRDGNVAECPAPGQTFPQPSKRAEPRGLMKRFDQQARFNCLRTSNRGDRFVYNVNIASGVEARSTDLGFTYSCTIGQPSGYRPLGCLYRGDGSFRTAVNGFDQADCPVRLCPAVRNPGRRSTRRGVYVAEDPIERRQLSAAKLRQQYHDQ